MPKFSIIIPVYDVAPYLRECLESLLTQSFGGWEALCVDDGSTDQSGIILDEYAERDKRIRVFHQSNAGVSAARNFAQHKVLGEWLMYLDSDDVYLPGALQFARTLIEQPFDAIVFNRPIDFENIPPLSIGGSGAIVDKTEDAETGYDFWNRHIAMPGFPFLLMLRAATFSRVDFPLGIKIMEDDVHLQSCLGLKSRWVLIDKEIYGYRRRSNSATGDVTAVGAVSGIDAMACILNELKTVGNLPDQYVARFWSQKRGIFVEYALKLLKQDYSGAAAFGERLRHFLFENPQCEMLRLVLLRLDVAKKIGVKMLDWPLEKLLLVTWSMRAKFRRGK